MKRAMARQQGLMAMVKAVADEIEGEGSKAIVKATRMTGEGW
jgi:hypothetical protein